MQRTCPGRHLAAIHDNHRIRLRQERLQSRSPAGVNQRADYRFRLLLFLLLFPFTGFSTGVHAQESMPDDLSGLSLEDLMKVRVATVTTASKTSEKATAAPGTVYVIDDRDIRLRGYSNLTDVLRDLPGMETVEKYFSEIGTNVPVRGIVGNNKIVVLVNGMRVNPPGGEYMPLRSDFSVRDAAQIEVVYGPGSTLYGQDAISAVINIKTREPQKDATGEIGLDGGVHNAREAWGIVGKALDHNKVRVTGYAQYNDSNLSRLDLDYPAWWQDYKNIAIPKGSGTVPDRTDFGLNAFARVEAGTSSIQAWRRQSTRSSAEGFSPALAFLPEARWGDSSTVLEGKNTTTLSSKVKLDSSLSYNHYEIDPGTRYVFPASTTQWFLNDYKYGRGTGTTLEETVRATPSPSLSLLAGMAASWYDIIPKSTVPGGADPNGNVVAQGGSFVYYTQANNPASMHLIPRVVRVKYQNYGGYLEAAWQASKKLRTTLGLRVDSDSRFNETPFVPRAAAIYNLTPNLTAKYIFTRAYRAPGPYFGFATFDNGTLLNTSNPGLRPETASSNEINLSYAKKNLNLGLSIYRGQQNNLILIADRGLPQNVIQDPVFLDLAGTQPRVLVHTVNGGSSANTGADLFGRAQFGKVNTWFSYSYVDFHENDNGISSGLAGISRHNVRLGATVAATPRLFVTPSLVFRSTPENVVAGSLQSELSTPWEANLYILYSRTKRLDLFAQLKNITNHKYALGGFVGQAFPEETFNGNLGLRYSF